jgi:hypothetical protein
VLPRRPFLVLWSRARSAASLSPTRAAPRLCLPRAQRRVSVSHACSAASPSPTRAAPRLRLPRVQRRVSVSHACSAASPVPRAQRRVSLSRARSALAPQRAPSSTAACSELKRAGSLGRPDHDRRMRLGPREPARPGACFPTERLSRKTACAAPHARVASVNAFIKAAKSQDRMRSPSRKRHLCAVPTRPTNTNLNPPPKASPASRATPWLPRGTVSRGGPGAKTLPNA